MPTVTCAQRISELETALENAREAAAWQEAHLRAELRALEAALTEARADLGNLRDELHERRSATPTAPIDPPRHREPPRSRIRVVHTCGKP